MKQPETVSEVNWWEPFFTTDMTAEEAGVMEQLFGTASFTTETNPDNNLDMYWTDRAPSYEDSGSRSNASSQLRNTGSVSIEPDRFIKDTDNACFEESNMNSSEMLSLSHQHKVHPLSKRKHEILKPPESEVNNGNSNGGITEKKPRALMNVEKSKKNTQQKKTKKSKKKNYESEDNGGTTNKQTSISCSSEQEDSCKTQENNGDNEKIIIKNSKSRAERGSATDPQSLYARKRRERINERLKILQNLIPNGTKVDISTMLEEAVQYVKFLQLQIKLLSSEDLWMYSPIAYNGMNIGLGLTHL